MQVGTETVSPLQFQFLDMARSGVATPELVDVFMRVVRDNDILEGRESLHPEWLTVFENKKSLLQEFAPTRVFDSITAFFDKLTAFDANLAELDPRTINISFLLGAGASKPDPSNIPTVKELLPELLARARRLDREDVTQLADFCERRKIDNIEDLLTAAQLSTFCSRNPTVLRLMNFLLSRGDLEDLSGSRAYERLAMGSERVDALLGRRGRDPAADLSSVAFLQDTLQVLFGLLASTMLPAKPNKAHEAIAKYVKAHGTSSIITTNYDCCITPARKKRIVGQAFQPDSEPCQTGKPDLLPCRGNMDLALGDVSKDFKYHVDFANVGNELHEPDCTILLKLHGSLNWFYCETCQEVHLVADFSRMVDNFLKDEAPYPVIGICRDCGGQRRGLLVPPLAMKFDLAPPLTPLVGYANAAFERSDLIIVVGFSFADADLYISRMLSKSMQTSTSQKMLIVDPDHRVVEKVRRKFKASIPNFDTKRISRMNKDCADMLPKFLLGELVKQVEGTSDASTTNDGGEGPSRSKRHTKIREPQKTPADSG